MGICSKLWHRACEHLLLQDDITCSVDMSDETMLKQAYQEMMQAQNLFSRVEDAEMIDCAVMNLIAAEKRYNYFLKKVKNRTQTL